MSYEKYKDHSAPAFWLRINQFQFGGCEKRDICYQKRDIILNTLIRRADHTVLYDVQYIICKIYSWQVGMKEVYKMRKYFSNFTLELLLNMSYIPETTYNILWKKVSKTKIPEHLFYCHHKLYFVFHKHYYYYLI